MRSEPSQKRRFEPLGACLLDALPESVRRNLPGWRGVIAWGDCVSREVASRSRAVAYHQGCLTVQVASSVWMHHLLALKRQLIADVNAAVGTGAGSPPIEDIHFVLSPGTSSTGTSSPGPVAP
jgi:hypothetical protein